MTSDPERNGQRDSIDFLGRATGLIALAASVLALAGCVGPSYYWQATAGHLALMGQRQPVADVLADPGTDPELRARLARARQIIDFSERHLDLPAGDSYRSLVETSGPVSWTVVATPAWSLRPKRWCFPIAGCVAYRGYFQRDRATAFAARLEQRGLDVAVLPVAAYSTLGWFDDPLLSSMLDREPAHLAGTLIHELAHQRLYVRDDTAFSEAYASYMEAAGVERWLSGQPDAANALAEWRAQRAAEASFTALVRRTREELARLYAEDPPPGDRASLKAAAFGRMREGYHHLVRDEWGGRDRFAGWMQADINNAHLVATGMYTGGRCAFERLMVESDGDFATFHGLAAAIARRPADERRQWLKQPCAAVASGPEL